MRRLAVSLLLLAAARLHAAGPVLERVELSGGAVPVVRLHLSAAAAAIVHPLAPDGPTPPRIYIDVAGTTLAAGAHAPLGGVGLVLRVRSGQFDTVTTRVVVELDRVLPYDFQVAGRIITLRLGSPLPPPVAAAVVPATPPAPRRAPPAAAAPPTEPPLVVIDPGHGGRDPGAEGVGGVLEKDVVLALAHRLATKLAQRLPVSVVLTRTGDSFLPIQDRLPAAEPPVAAFVSLHANAWRDPQPSGVEIFYGGGLWHPATTTGTDPRARALGRALARALDAKLGAVRGDARPGPFAVLVRNPAPAALVEVGFLTHPADAALARAEAFQEVLTDALVEGVAAFLRVRTPL